jgi:hypothetical protein
VSDEESARANLELPVKAGPMKSVDMTTTATIVKLTVDSFSFMTKGSTTLF